MPGLTGPVPVDGGRADPGQGRRGDRGSRPHRSRTEFEDDVLNFLVHTASLVAGAIENAQLYEETRRRAGVTTLTELSQALAAVTVLQDLYVAVTRVVPRAAGGGRLQIYRLDAEADELVLAGSGTPGRAQAEPAGCGRRWSWTRCGAPKAAAAAAVVAGQDVVALTWTSEVSCSRYWWPATSSSASSASTTSRSSA